MSTNAINVKQIASYPPVTSAGAGDLLLIQPGGLGNSYASISAPDLVTSALASGVALQLAPGAAQITSDGSTFACNTTFRAIGLQADVIGANSVTALEFVQDGDRVATAPELVSAISQVVDNSVTSFNQRIGDVVLQTDDILRAGGAPQVDAHFAGWITAPSPWDPGLDDDTVATTRWSQRAMCAFMENWLELQPVVFTFNGRAGNITLLTSDINAAYSVPGVYPTAPNPTIGDASNRIATTLFVDDSLEDLHSTVTNEWNTALTTGYAPLASPALTGIPTAPTANAGTSTGQLATTAFVHNAVVASTTGVSSFNTRTGAVTLSLADVTGAGGAPVASPAFTGAPTAPTLSPGTNNTGLATTAFVAAAVTAGTAGVSSFNTRTGAVTLTLTDVTNTGILASPVLTGVPVAPTATTGNASTQLATTQFVANAITSMTAGVASFNGRTGAVTLQGSDVSAAGGALVASPAFTGAPTAPTPAPGTSSTVLATTAFVSAALTAGVVTTFNGRAGAVTMTLADVTGVGGAPLASPAFTGTPSAPTAAPGTSSTQVATTAFVSAAVAPAAVTPGWAFSAGGGSSTMQALGGGASYFQITGGQVNSALVFNNAAAATSQTNSVLWVQDLTSNALSVANYPILNNNVTGQPVILKTGGTDTNRSIQLVPAGSGTVQAPTMAPGTNSTAVATTAFVAAATAAVGGGLISNVVYSASGTITIPAGATRAMVRMWGATGGSGGVGTGGTGWTGGTGAGGYLEKYETGLTPGGTLIYTQGAAGAAGTATGGAGGSATVTTLASGTQTIATLTCNGSTGSLGTSTGATPGTAGGTATGGDLNATGQGGQGAGDPASAANSPVLGGHNFFSLGASGVKGSSVAGNAGNPGGLTIAWYP